MNNDSITNIAVQCTNIFWLPTLRCAAPLLFLVFARATNIVRLCRFCRFLSKIDFGQNRVGQQINQNKIIGAAHLNVKRPWQTIIHNSISNYFCGYKIHESIQMILRFNHPEKLYICKISIQSNTPNLNVQL